METVKKYKLMFSVTLIEGEDSIYSPKKVLDFNVKENLPTNVDAQQYIRKRLSEEVKRNFDSLHEPIENMTVEVKENIDPLDAF